MRVRAAHDVVSVKLDVSNIMFIRYSLIVCVSVGSPKDCRSMQNQVTAVFVEESECETTVRYEKIIDAPN